jgi:hypothetical protein
MYTPRSNLCGGSTSLPLKSYETLSYMCDRFHSHWSPGYSRPLDFELTILEHFASRVSRTLSDCVETQRLWLSFTQECSQYPYVTHGLLAVSALHLAQDPVARSASPVNYKVLAIHHHAAVLSLIRPQIAKLSSENSNALYARAVLIFFFAVAFPRPRNASLGEDIAILSNLAKGINAVLRGSPQSLETGVVRPMVRFRPWSHLWPPLPDGFAKPIEAVERVVECLGRPKSAEADIYGQALYSLKQTLRAMVLNKDQPAMVFMWLVLVDPKYITLLGRLDYPALRILACYAECVRLGTNRWWMKSWLPDLETKIKAHVDGKWTEKLP